MDRLTLQTVLRLARISNLPTVWTNVLTGMLLTGSPPNAMQVVVFALVGSLLYTGGMILNDAFDATSDARERPDRPIPMGEISRGTAFGMGGGLVAAGCGLALVASRWGVCSDGWPFIATCGCAVLVVIYDRWHKGNPAAPVLMGVCRALLYVLGAAVAGGMSPFVGWSAIALLVYVAGITYVARFEAEGRPDRRWTLALLYAPFLLALATIPSGGMAWATMTGFCVWVFRAVQSIQKGRPADIQAGVTALIAGISLLDGMLTSLQSGGASLLCLGGFALTVRLQRRIRGT